MKNSLKEKVIKALNKVKDPDLGRSIVSLGMVSGLQVSANGDVLFMIEVDGARGAMLEPLRQKAEKAALSVKGVGKVTAVLTAQRKVQKAPMPDPHGNEKSPALDLPIRHIIAVASGKGGVGKSTVAANLAINLAKNGQKVGLLDADIYGPSVPNLMGLVGEKPKTDKNNKIIPLLAHGVKIMSIGFMIKGDAPLVWRAPMVQSALYQMLRDVAWGEPDDLLDILIVDMPPGTGDIQLTMAQKTKLSGVVIVSTPQDLALIDARKAVSMFEKVGVPVLGMIENMSTHICSACGHEEHIFGHGGAHLDAKKMGIPFLGEIPLSSAIRAKSDAGKPFGMDAVIVQGVLSRLSGQG